MRSRLLRPDPYNSALAGLIAAAFSDDAFIVVLGEDDRRRSQLLGRAAAELAHLRCRVVRASADLAAELSLDDLVGQVSAQAALGTPGDLLERAHRLLTEVDPSLDRVLLLIEHADRLSSSALRFLQLTTR